MSYRSDDFGDPRFRPAARDDRRSVSHVEPIAVDPRRAYDPRDAYGSPFVAEALATDRSAFIRRTYFHLAVAVAAFMGLEAALLGSGLAVPITTALGRNWWLALLAFVGVSWLAQWWANSGTSRVWQYLGLALFVVAEAVIVLPMLYLASRIDVMIPATAGMLTAMIFLGLTAYVFITGQNFGFLGGFLTIASLAAIGVIVAGLIFGFNVGTWFSGAMVALMAAYILYDTSNVLHRYRTDQHVAAALALFASVATLFFYLLRLLSAFRD